MEFNLTKKEKVRLTYKHYYYNNLDKIRDYQKIYQMNYYLKNKDDINYKNRSKKYRNQVILNKLKFETLHIPIDISHYYITLYFD